MVSPVRRQQRGRVDTANLTGEGTGMRVDSGIQIKIVGGAVSSTERHSYNGANHQASKKYESTAGAVLVDPHGHSADTLGPAPEQPLVVTATDPQLGVDAEAIASQRLASAEQTLSAVDAKLDRLRAELAKGEVARAAAAGEVAAATEELAAATVTHEAAKAHAKKWHPPCDAASRAVTLGEQNSVLSSCWDMSAALPLPRPTDWLGLKRPELQECRAATRPRTD